MGDPINLNWQQTLGEVERSVAECLAALDRYEAAFARVLEEPNPPATFPKREGVSTDGWDAMISTARASAEEIDRLLAGSEAGWVRWRDAFSAWRLGIEQPPAERHEELSHVEGRGDSAGGGEVEPVRRVGEEAVPLA